jgi:hypothetical protein
MTDIDGRWWRQPAWQGLISGWLVGMLWWAGLMVAFGPSTIVEGARGVVVERPITVASRLIYAPLMAIPWAFVGLLVGVAKSHFRGQWVTSAAAVGTVAGGVCALATHLFDGWLTWIMPACCLGGALIGLVLGVVASAVLGLSRDMDG